MSLDSPTTRLSTREVDSPPSTPSPLSFTASNLFEHTLTETRSRIKGDRKGKGKASPTLRRSRRRKDELGGGTHEFEVEIGRGQSVDSRLDHPPTYGEAVEQQQQTTRRRRRTRSNSSRSSVSSSATDGTDDDEEEDALSSLLNLTTSLLASSSEILSASKDLHSQLSQFLLSSSPPTSSSSTTATTTTTTNLLMNDVRSELGLNGDNWDRLNRLERDVEKFGMKKQGKDPRNQLSLATTSSRRTSLGPLPVVGIVTENSMGTVKEEDSQEDMKDGRESDRVFDMSRDGRTLGLGRPSGAPSSSGIEATSALAKKGHMRRSSTAKDLLLQISTSTSSSPNATPSSTLSRRPSTSRDALDSLSTPHRLSISPSLPSLSSSISTASHSTIMTTSPPPPLSSSDHVLSRLSSKSIPTRALSVSPSPTPSILSSSISNTSLSTSPANHHSPATIDSQRRSIHSSPPHRRSSTMSKSISVAKLDAEQDPLRRSSGQSQGSIRGSMSSRTDEVLVEERETSGNAAADRLRNLQNGSAGASGSTAGAAGSGSWWSWR